MLSDLPAEPLSAPATTFRGNAGHLRGPAPGQPLPGWRGRPATRLIGAALLAYGAAGIAADLAFLLAGAVVIAFGAGALAYRSSIATGPRAILAGAGAIAAAGAAFAYHDVLIGAVGAALGVAVIAYGAATTGPRAVAGRARRDGARRVK